jgi:hypothetical protein
MPQLGPTDMVELMHLVEEAGTSDFTIQIDRIGHNWIVQCRRHRHGEPTTSGRGPTVAHAIANMEDM